MNVNRLRSKNNKDLKNLDKAEQDLNNLTFPPGSPEDARKKRLLKAIAAKKKRLSELNK